MKRILFYLLIFLAGVHSATGQVSRMPKIKLGIIAPVFLDSVFNGKNYKYSQNNFPRFSVPGLDFMHGAMIALDSLASLEIKIEARILDAMSEDPSLTEMIKTGKLDDLDMIIASVKETNFLVLSAFAKKKKIPFISATFPNDAGIRNNPYTVIVNPTLMTHCETLFAYLLQNHGTEKILLVRKNGSQEDKVESYFNSVNTREGKPFLRIETVRIDSNFVPLKNKLDSNRTNVIIGGSLDEEFATDLSGFLFSNMKKYPVKLIGMPNWDGFSMSKKGKYKDLPVYFSGAYPNKRTDTLSSYLREIYLEKFGGLPSEIAYQGFESTFYFGTLLSAHDKDLFPNLNQPELPNLPLYKFRPAFRGDNSMGPDYYENRHLYILKILNGAILQSW